MYAVVNSQCKTGTSGQYITVYLTQQRQNQCVVSTKEMKLQPYIKKINYMILFEKAEFLKKVKIGQIIIFFFFDCTKIKASIRHIKSV